MIIGLAGCNQGDISQYIYQTGTFLRAYGNMHDWAVFVPSPTNPNWIFYGRLNDYGVYYWANLSLEAGAKEIGRLASLGWQWEQPNMMPGSIWVFMVGYVWAAYATLGLSDIFFVVAPKITVPRQIITTAMPSQSGTPTPSISGYPNP